MSLTHWHEGDRVRVNNQGHALDLEMGTFVEADAETSICVADLDNGITVFFHEKQLVNVTEVTSYGGDAA